jgi:hypothetical protein
VSMTLIELWPNCFDRRCGEKGSSQLWYDFFIFHAIADKPPTRLTDPRQLKMDSAHQPCQ